MSNNHQGAEDQNPNPHLIRDIHALTPSSILPDYPPVHQPFRSYLSMSASDHQAFRDDFSVASVTNSTLVVAGSVIGSMGGDQTDGGGSNRMTIIGEDYGHHVPPSSGVMEVVVPVTSVKKEEVESKIIAWRNAKVAEITNRFKCEDAIIKGWEDEQVQKASLKMKQVERKLEEKKARAMEKMENEIAKAHHKAEERRASAESIRGRKMARVIEVANLMKAVGRSPVKNFF